MASAREWKERITEWKASGTSATEFAARHGISSQRLYNWSSRFLKAERLRSKAKQTTAPVRLLRVVPTRSADVVCGGSAMAAPSAIRLTMADVSVDVQAGFDEATLRKVLEVVKSLRGSGL
jgi:hypothetical protein